MKRTYGQRSYYQPYRTTNPRKRRNRPYALMRFPYGNNLRTQRYYRGGVVKKRNCVEVKFAEYIRAHNVSTGWTMLDPLVTNCLNAVGAGSGESDRDGRMQAIQSFHLNGVIFNDHAASGTAFAGLAVRIVLVLDRQTNKTQMLPTTLYNDSSVLDPIGEMFFFMDLENTQRYRILWSRVFKLESHKLQKVYLDFANVSGTGTMTHGFEFLEQCIPFKVNIKFKKPIIVHYTDSNATVASITDNSLHLLGCSYHTPGLNVVNADIKYRCRIRFTD